MVQVWDGAVILKYFWKSFGSSWEASEDVMSCLLCGFLQVLVAELVVEVSRLIKSHPKLFLKKIITIIF